MAEQSEITWTDATFNPWIGCTKVSPACDSCYAERDNQRRGWVEGWGPGVPRKRTSAANWQGPLHWDKVHLDFYRAHGRKRRVFAASLADIFDNEVPGSWREDFWKLVAATPNLQWLILTKRIGNAWRMLPADWAYGYLNVVLISTVVNQDEWERDVLKLLTTPAQLRGVSVEPMLARIIGGELLKRLQWVICGGESGPEPRGVNPAWPRGLRDECATAGVPFHFKQWGELLPDGQMAADGSRGLIEGGVIEFAKLGKKKSGRYLDGVVHSGFPEQL